MVREHMELLSMNRSEIKRLEAMASLKTKALTQVQIALQLQISERQVRRLWLRFQREGAAGVVSGNRGRQSNNRLHPDIIDRAITLVADRYADFGPTFANEKLRDVHDLKIGTETLRQAMIRANLWTPKIKRRRKIHPPRERRPQFGELVQIDGSPHDWFEGRAPRCSLIVFIDDATSRLVALRFVTAETTWAYFNTLHQMLVAHGRPLALYSDKHSIFRTTYGLHTKAQTQFGRALEELDIDLICANSPQAKGRVERVNRTLQRRLIREMRLRNISSMTAANEYLTEFLTDHNSRFSIAPASDINAHRTLEAIDLSAILSIRTRRELSKDRIIQLNRNVYFVDDPRAYNFQKVTVLEREDETFELRDEDDGLPLRFHKLRSLNEQGQIRTAKDLNAHIDRRTRAGKKAPPLPPNASVYFKTDRPSQAENRTF